MKKSIILLILFLSVFSLKGMAQMPNMPDLKAKYLVSDNLLKRNFTEIWTYRPTPSPEDPNAYILNKQPVPKEIRAKEVKSFWHKLVVLTTNKESRHFRERFSQDPGELENGESTFGHIEVWETGSERIVEAWPAFVKVKGLSEEIQEATFTIYLSGGRILTIVKIYDSRYYPLPFVENQKLTKDGVVKEDITFRMEK